MYQQTDTIATRINYSSLTNGTTISNILSRQPILQFAKVIFCSPEAAANVVVE